MSVKFHASSGTYRLTLRAALSGIRSEKAFRDSIVSAINRQTPSVAVELLKKWFGGKEFEVLSYLGVVTQKVKLP
jgi:hypothetical protein